MLADESCCDEGAESFVIANSRNRYIISMQDLFARKQGYIAVLVDSTCPIWFPKCLALTLRRVPYSTIDTSSLIWFFRDHFPSGFGSPRLSPRSSKYADSSIEPSDLNTVTKFLAAHNVLVEHTMCQQAKTTLL